MHQPTDNTKKGCILTILAFLTFSAFIYSAYSTYLNCGFFPTNNPTTRGIIIKSSIEKSEFERRGYSLEVIYQYFVDNKEYKSSTICCGSSANEFTKDILSKYPVGTYVTVYYRENSHN